MTNPLRTHLQRSTAVFAEMADGLADPVARAAQLLIDALKAGRTVYVCGDGGSASQSQHAAGELVGRFLKDRPPLACIALPADVAVITAVGNDYGFDHVFERQVDALVRPGDVLWCLSTSGTSPNVVVAAAAARRRGAKVIGLTGRTGGKLKELCDVAICVPADSSPHVQEGHLAILHVLCAMVEHAMFPDGGSHERTT